MHFYDIARFKPSHLSSIATVLLSFKIDTILVEYFLPLVTPSLRKVFVLTGTALKEEWSTEWDRITNSKTLI